MLRYGKTARQAVAAMSYLAERWGEESGPAPSAEVGRARQMPAPLAAKLLSELSAVGLAVGTTGPGGGYVLAKAPAKISLADIVWTFERQPGEYPCPFGPGWCGNNNPCPLHDSFVEMEERATEFLEHTTLEVFVPGPVR